VSDTPTTRDAVHALCCVLLWMLGALAARGIGLWLGVGVMAVLIGVLAIALERHTLRTLTRFDARALGAGIVVGVIMTAMTYVLHRPATESSSLIARDVATLYTSFRILPLTDALLLLPLPIVCEEIVWRGVVQSSLARRIGPSVAAVASAFAYALGHAPFGSFTLVLTCVGCGLCWGALRAGTRGLLAPLVAHLIWDYSVLVAWPIHA
jgi:membrane protease YdiL (CAAX protease family)